MQDDIQFSKFMGISLEAWRGNEPKEIEDGVSIWVCRWGSASMKNGKVLTAEFHLSNLVCVDIVGDRLSITDLRSQGTHDVYEYCNKPECTSKSMFRLWHPLEEERIEKYLNKKIECKLWRMVRKRAYELYKRG